MNKSMFFFNKISTLTEELYVDDKSAGAKNVELVEKIIFI
jgi:hypothetical protein